MAVLYHASRINNLSRIEPRSDHPRYRGEKPLVFATQDIRIAAMFLVPKEAGTAEICMFGNTAVLIMVSTVNDFIAYDRGGSIYSVESTDFVTNSTLDMKNFEWTNPQPVTPIAHKTFKTALSALRLYGVSLYFVDDQLYTKIINAPDHGWSILQKLSPYV